MIRLLPIRTENAHAISGGWTVSRAFASCIPDSRYLLLPAECLPQNRCCHPPRRKSFQTVHWIEWSQILKASRHGDNHEITYPSKPEVTISSCLQRSAQHWSITAPITTERVQRGSGGDSCTLVNILRELIIAISNYDQLVN